MFIKRLDQFIRSKDLSYYAFENSINASRGSISKAIKNEKSIGSNVIENIINEYPDLNAYWLFTGKGEMILKEDSNNLDSKMLDKFDKLRIIKHIQTNLVEYKQLRSFQLLLTSSYNDHEMQRVKDDIETLKIKVEKMLKSK